MSSVPIMRSGSTGSRSKAFLVERYVPGITKDQFDAAERRIRRTVRELAATGAPIRLVSSALIPIEEIVLSVFEASAEETVIDANVRSGVHVDRVQPAELSLDEDLD